MQMILASNNPKKLIELRAIMSGSGFEILSLREAGITHEPEETGVTFAENAFIKAKAALDAAGLPALADDSGLCCNALGGAPGVYSARYGGFDSDEERNIHLLRQMEGHSDRSAYFACAICCLFPDGRRLDTYGECRGQLLTAPAGEGGFGYDPLLFLPEQGMTAAQLSPEVKNRVSHRAKALARLREALDRL